jgi:hypothetical protein
MYGFEDSEKEGVCVDSEPGWCGGGPRPGVAKCGGLDFLFFVLNSVFILRPLNFMIAMVRNLRTQKKTVSGLCGRRSTALSNPSVIWFWFFKSLHFATPNY